jgi:AcrR family transcriptional regulator
MSYPKKISSGTVLDCALSYVEAHGLAELSMRSLATELGVTPNALYRYFASKAELEYAMAEEGGKRLLVVLEKAAAKKSPDQAMVAVAKAYFKFARSNPELYALKMRHCRRESEPDSYDAVWRFVMSLASALPTCWDAQDLAMSLWAFLHGMVELDRADMLHGRKPETTIDVGLQVMLAGLMTGLKG